MPKFGPVSTLSGKVVLWRWINRSKINCDSDLHQIILMGFVFLSRSPHGRNVDDEISQRFAVPDTNNRRKKN